MHTKSSYQATESNLTDGLNDFLDHCRIKNLSANTVVFYKDRLNTFLSFCQFELNISSLDVISAAHIRTFISHIMEAGYSGKTVDHCIQAIKTFFMFLTEEGQMPASPAVRIKRQRLERRIIETFSQEQVDLMLGACNRKTFIGLRDYTMILTLLDTGLRVSELCGLRLRDIDWSARFLKVMGKGNKERVVPFGSQVSKILKEYLKRRCDIVGEDHLFLTHFGTPMDRSVAGVLIRKVGKSAGVTNVRVSPHTFRHTFAKNWILGGGDSFSLQRILGHTTQHMVSQYVNLAVGDLKVQHMKFSPVDRLVVQEKTRKVILR